jgi:CO/xanthine dehydrogenase Mo-binding subunit
MSTSSPAASVGRNVPRVDGVAKVTGAARYVDDLPALPGELHGATVRSPIARGRIRSIRLDPAFDWSDVTVVLADDVPHNIVAVIAEDQPVLAKDRVNHAYEPIALVACADRHKLALAKERVLVDIEPETAVLDIPTALAKSTVVWGEDNVMKRYLITKGEAEKSENAAEFEAFVASHEVVVRGTYTTHHQEQMYIEPQGMVAYWDDAGVHIVGSIQCPYYVHKAFVKAFDLPAEAIDVGQAVTGGGFGGKEEYPSILALHAALLAKKAGRPVRMIYDRKEDIEATTKRHPCVCEVVSGCDKDGTLHALAMRVVMDGGAYVTLTPVVLSRGTLHAAGAYRWPHVRVESLAVATNTPPNGAFRGFGAPQTIWAVERHLDAIARELHMDPAALREKNMLRLGDTTATGQKLALSVAADKCLAKALEVSGYAEKWAKGPVVEGRKARGVGLSLFLHGAGFTGSGERYLKGKVALDLEPGGRINIRTGSTDIGQGTETVFRQIASDAAGIPLDAVDFAVPRTTVVPDSGPTVASRTVMVVGSIVEGAAREIGARVEAERAAGGGSFAEAGDRLLAKGPLSLLRQYQPPDYVVWDDVTYKGDAYPCFGWACDVAEVEVDLDTFEVNVLGFWSATDVGKAIHPLMCVGQIEGGSLQAVGWALWEDLVWKDGRIQNPRMTNYIIPTALDAPPFHIALVEEPFPFGPGGGAKGIGEMPMDGGAPAIAAAVEHATGIVMDSLPLLPERLFAARAAQRKTS